MRRTEDQFWCELLADGDDNPLKRVDVVRIALDAALPTNVDVHARPCPDTAPPIGAVVRVGVELGVVVPVNGDVEDRRVVVEGLLRAVACANEVPRKGRQFSRERDEERSRTVVNIPENGKEKASLSDQAPNLRGKGSKKTRTSQ